MLPSRRGFIVGAGAAAFAMCAAPARAIVPDGYQTLMRRVMNLGWFGQARIRTDQFVGDQLISNIGMKFELGSDWSFAGLMLETVVLDNVKYQSRSTIWGECWVIGDKAGLTISRMRHDEGSRLPAPYTWGTSTGSLRFYNDSDRAGRFALQGILKDDRDGTIIEVQMNDMD